MKLIVFKKRLALSLALVFTLFLSNSCEDFLDVNTDPDAAIADQASPDLLFAPVVAKISANRMADGGFFVGLWTQQFNQNGSSGLFRGIERYSQFQVIIQNLWNTGYEDGLKNLRFAQLSAENSVPVRPNAIAQAKLMTGWMYFYLTTFFGDIPLTEALNGIENQAPMPDSQEQVFNSIVSIVDEALAQIDVNNPAPPITNGDYFYGGNMEQWIKFGNSLKLKALMFLAGRDNSYQSQVAALINSGAPMMEVAADNAESPFFDVANNENNLFKFGVTVANGVPQSDTWYADVNLLNIMEPNNDPRIRIYFQPSRTATTDDILGRISGETGFDTEVSELSLNILRADFPDRMLTADETQLYIAEAYARGYVTGSPDLANADLAFKQAINASLDFWNANVTYDPTVAVSDDARAAFIDQAAFDLTSLSAEDALVKIYEEHYVANIIRGAENWAQVRRVDFPQITSPEQALFSVMPERYLYPNEETSSNPNIENTFGRTDPLWFKENQ